ncbi:MAG: OmpH family outer membrane protein [Bacteroidaceae bacterium]|jgi:outer membrane protein|nr:OmpH family outer membrane protein [Bacteroidaceae bacterium]MCR4836321.1 OmpH family outer membrane protein [Bacteroidaceae bacterium]
MKKLIILALIMLPMSAFAQKFAHVNSAVIINAMPEYTKARTDLEALAKQYEDELKRIQDEFRTKLEDYQKNGETLPETMKQRRQQELQDLDTRMTQYRQTAEEDLSKQESTKLAEISEKVGKAIKEIGSAGGYVYIMDVTSGIPFINETLSTDVTDQVKAKLGIK